MKHIEISACKGGARSTTFSVLTAIALAKDGKKVLLVDTSKYGDTYAVIGMSGNAPLGQINEVIGVENLSLICLGLDIPMPTVYENYDHIIYDAGVHGFQKYPTNGEAIHRIGAVSNEYLSLRNITMMNNKFDDIVLFMNDGFALNDKDVKVLTHLTPLATMSYDPVVARAIDAGLLTSRFEQLLSDRFKTLVKALTLSEALA